MNRKREEYPGKCVICEETVDKRQMTRHLKKCVEQSTPENGKQLKLFHIIAEGKYLPMYWLHFEIPGAQALEDLDSFLRHIWLECCGHISCFTIDGQRYSAHPIKDPMFGGPREKSMKQKLYKVLEKGSGFEHEYDYGSPTNLSLRVVNVREAAVKSSAVSILARNLPPELKCCRCSKPATLIRSLGWGFDRESLFCDECMEGYEEDYLPVVNSPRTGVCGYCG